MRATYGHVLSLPGAALFSASGLVSRLPLSMASLGLVLLVTERGGGYGAAGLVAAAYAVKKYSKQAQDEISFEVSN